MNSANLRGLSAIVCEWNNLISIESDPVDYSAALAQKLQMPDSGIALAVRFTTLAASLTASRDAVHCRAVTYRPMAFARKPRDARAATNVERTRLRPEMKVNS
jgi:hypothetical protein